MKKLLFLDIDGVLNTLMIYDKPIGSRRASVARGRFYYDICSSSDLRVSNTQAVMWLNKLCIENDLDIVISSCWIIGHTLDEIRQCLYNSGLFKDINIIGFSHNSMLSNRGECIEQYINHNNIDLNKAVILILDDDSDMHGKEVDFTCYLVQCNNYVGFTFNEYNKANNILELQKYKERI